MRILAPLLGFVFMLAAAGAATYLYLDIQSSAAHIGNARDQIAAIAARDTFAKTAAQFLAETSAERAAIQFFLTPEEGTASAIELVERAADIAKVKAVVGSAKLTALPEPHHEQLDITVSAEGTFAGMARFGTVLESLPTGASVSEVRLEATDKGWLGTFVISFIKLK